MKKQTIFRLLLSFSFLLILLFAFLSIRFYPYDIPPSTYNVKISTTPTLYCEFDQHDPEIFEKSTGENNYGSAHPTFNNIWAEDNISFTDGKMKISITPAPEGSTRPWAGGEYKTKDLYHYGLYEWRIRADHVSGIIFSGFIFLNDPGNPYDQNEIDIEIMGKNPIGNIEFAYHSPHYDNPDNLNGKIYDTGFNPSRNFHIYAFAWLPNEIIWYVDGVETWRVPNDGLIASPSMIIMNGWVAGSGATWAGEFDGTTPASIEYDRFRYYEYIA